MGIMRSKASLVRTLVSVARMAASERALPASVPPMPPTSQFSSSCSSADAVGDFLRKSVSRAGNACADRLAEYDHVGLEILGARVAAGAGADGMGFVDDQKRSVLARDFAKGLMVSGLGMDDADISHRGLRQNAGDIIGMKCGFERIHVVELDDLGGDRGIDGRSDVSGPRACGAVGVKGDESFVDRAVIAPVEDQNFRAAGNLAGEADREAISVGGGERELPVGKVEALLQFFGDEDRVFARGASA